MIFGCVRPVIDTTLVGDRTEAVKAEKEFLSIMLHGSIFIIWMDIFPILHRLTIIIVTSSNTATAASTTASSTMTLGMRTDTTKVIFTTVETYDSV